MDKEQATQGITRELFATHPTRRGCMAFESLDISTQEAFRDGAERWLKDRSELDGEVYELADWDEIYSTFSGWGGWNA